MTGYNELLSFRLSVDFDRFVLEIAKAAIVSVDRLSFERQAMMHRFGIFRSN